MQKYIQSSMKCVLTKTRLMRQGNMKEDCFGWQQDVKEGFGNDNLTLGEAAEVGQAKQLGVVFLDRRGRPPKHHKKEGRANPTITGDPV